MKKCKSTLTMNERHQKLYKVEIDLESKSIMLDSTLAEIDVDEVDFNSLPKLIRRVSATQHRYIFNKLNEKNVRFSFDAKIKNSKSKWVWTKCFIKKEDNSLTIHLYDMSDEKFRFKTIINERKRYKNIFKETRDCIMVLTNNVITECNSAMAKILGIDNTDYVEFKSIQDISDKNINPAIQVKLINFLTSTTKEKEMNTQWSFCKVDGEVVKTTIKLAKSTINEQRITIMSVKDITEDLKVEKAKEILKESAHNTSKFSSLGILASGIGHEINNPLTIISGYNGLLKSVKGTIDAETQVSIDQVQKVISQQCDRIKKIVDGVRTYALPTKDNVTFNLNEIVRSTVKFTEPIFNGEEIEIVQKLSEEELLVKGDRAEIQQGLLELMTNARHALYKMKNKQITIKTEVENNKARLSITDNGCGVAESIKDKILDPFFTTKEPGQGTGLGLSSLFSNIQKMNGQLFFDSMKFLTTFCIDLPLVNQINNTKEEVMETKVALVVDDEKQIQDLLQMFLEIEGYSVEKANDGEEGLEKLRKKKYDAVFTDVQMPKLSGIDMIKAANSEKLITPETIVCIVTGDILSDYTNQNLVDGSEVTQIYKPFSDEMIEDALKSKDKK